MVTCNTAPMAGKIVVVTGATGGIGRATAMGLAGLGARIAITGRDAGRAEAAASEIRGGHADADVDVFVADMSSLQEVRRLAAELAHRYARIDVLVNNVGGYWNHRQVTVDGLERTFALNHLAPFLLTNLLLERLTAGAPARVVTVSSNAQAMGRIDFDDLQGERSYSGARAYNQSKLANLLFSYELARRLSDRGRHGERAAPGRGPHRLRCGGPRPSAEADHAGRPAAAEEPGEGRGDVDLPGVVTGGRGRDRPVLRQLQAEEVSPAELRPG